MRISGTQLACARKFIDETSYETAEALGVCRSTYSLWETGRPPKGRLNDIYKFFKGRGVEFINDPNCTGVLKRNGFTGA